LPLIALVLAPLSAMAQGVTLYGALSNMDVVNDTGGEVHGFEIEFRGVTGVYSYYNWNRYGPPIVTPIPDGSGTYVRWLSPYDPATQTFVTGTPQALHPTPLTGHQCVIGTPGYATSGCEHFGMSTTGNPTQTIYRWLVADPASPGQLKAGTSLVAIPAPVWVVQPPVVPGAAPVVVAQVDPPIPPPPAKLFGDAQWMKTYKTENGRQVLLDELVADNAVVPQDDAHLETAWDLMQTELGSNSRRKQKRGSLSAGSHAVVRRFEFYKFTGAVDPVTGQAICLDGTCSAPAPSEVGDFIGAQNAAADLNAPASFAVTVTVAGDGQVSSGDRVIKCPGICTEQLNPGASVTLTSRGIKGVFAGWGGACGGNSLTCTVSVNSDAPVTATFLNAYKLVVKGNGSGSVSSDPSGGTYLQGTVVTVTAVPGAGATWRGWTGGGCSGLALTCAVTMNTDATVQANFR
jgi:hypothetical protein